MIVFKTATITKGTWMRYLTFFFILNFFNLFPSLCRVSVPCQVSKDSTD